MTRLIALDLRPDERKLRVFGFCALVVSGVLGASARYAWPPFSQLSGSRVPLAFTLLALALLSGLFSLLWPRANRPLYVVLSLLAYPIGVVTSYAVLALLFFGVFTPLGLVLRLLGKDPLQRGFDRSRASYWTTPRRARDKASYFRGF